MSGTPSPEIAGALEASGALSIADVLDRAADLIEPEGAWIQGKSAQKADGSYAAHESDDAECWCLFGAYERAGGRGGDSGWDFIKAVIDPRPVTWNDAPERTQSEVVAKLREASALAREKGL